MAITETLKDFGNSMWENQTFMNIVKIATILVIIKLIYTWYTGRSSTVTLVKNKRCASKKIKLSRELIKKSLIGHEFTLGLWLYVKDWGINTSQPQHVLHIGDADGASVSPGIWLYPKNNNIMVRMDTHNKIDGYQKTINCGGNASPITSLQDAQKKCIDAGYLRVCTKNEVISDKKSHQVCCPAWTNSKANAPDNNVIGWYQGANTDSVLKAPLRSYKNKTFPEDSPYMNRDMPSYPDEGSNQCLKYCDNTDTCSAFTIKDNKCNLWAYVASDGGGNVYPPGPPELESGQNTTTFIPQTGDAICGKNNTWHSRIADTGSGTTRKHALIGAHCCGKSMKPSPNDTPDKQCDIVNVPLQRWVNLVIVLHNKSLDVYLNGELKRSCILENIPKLNGGDVYITHNGGFNGFVSDITYKNAGSKAADIYDSYHGLLGGKETILNKIGNSFTGLMPSMPKTSFDIDVDLAWGKKKKK